MPQAQLSKALKTHGAPIPDDSHVEQSCLRMLAPFTACLPRAGYFKLGILISFAATMCIFTMFWGVARYDSHVASLSNKATFSQYRFSPRLHSRCAQSGCVHVPIQISELEFRSDQYLISLALANAIATNPGGRNPIGEGPLRAIDGQKETKWVDFSYAPLLITFPAPIALTSFRFVTANDFPERDPAQWKMEGSNGRAWTLLHSQDTDYPKGSEPLKRFQPTDWFDWFDFDEPHWGDHLRAWKKGKKKKHDVPANSNNGSFLQCRFTPTRLRRQESEGVQLSEIEFKDGDTIISMRQMKQSIRADMLGGNSPPHEGPDKAIDGNRNTKWFDYSKGPLMITWEQAQHVTAFRFTTANDYSGRDPIRWYLQCAADPTSPWVAVHTQQQDYATPILRRTSTQWFAIDPGSTLELEQRSIAPLTHSFNYSANDWNYSNHHYYDYRYEETLYCLSTLRLRNEETGMVQIAELEFKNASGVVNFSPDTYATSSGSHSGSNPNFAMDQNASTMWSGVHPATLCIAPVPSFNLTQFRFRTANRFPGRDPVQWNFHKWYRNDGFHVFSTLLREQAEDYATPTERYTWTEWFDVNMSAVPVDMNHDIDNEVISNPFDFPQGGQSVYDDEYERDW